MIKKKFEEVARETSSDYELVEELQVGVGFITFPVSCHKLTHVHNNIPIKIVFEFGNEDIGVTTADLPKFDKTLFFHLEKMNHWKRLFKPFSNSLLVVTNYPRRKRLLENIVGESGLENIARETQFEPRLYFTVNSGTLEMKLEYYLGFQNKEEAIHPTLEFFKRMIAEMEL